MGWHDVRFKDVPECCKGCKHLEHDSIDEYSPSYYFCVKGLFIPTKKKECKKSSNYRLADKESGCE